MNHSYDPLPRAALTITPAPNSNTRKPTQSQRVHVARHRSTRSARHARNRSASASTAQTTTSSPRTNGATVLVGRDTRASGPELEAALARGLVAGGSNVTLGGVLPTPA